MVEVNNLSNEAFSRIGEKKFRQEEKLRKIMFLEKRPKNVKFIFGGPDPGDSCAAV